MKGGDRRRGEPLACLAEQERPEQGVVLIDRGVSGAALTEQVAPA
jgi:hypothetical protein